MLGNARVQTIDKIHSDKIVSIQQYLRTRILTNANIIKYKVAEKSRVCDAIENTNKY